MKKELVFSCKKTFYHHEISSIKTYNTNFKMEKHCLWVGKFKYHCFRIILSESPYILCIYTYII